MKHYTIVEVAKLLKGILKQAFPETKFSIRSDKYSMGSSIRINWTDGPLESQVNPLVKCFEGASFDGMQDLKEYNGPQMFRGEQCRFGGDYIFCNRHVSEVALQIAAYKVHKEHKLPLLEVVKGDLVGGQNAVPFIWFVPSDKILPAAPGEHGEYLARLVHMTARHLSFAKQAAEVELPMALWHEVEQRRLNLVQKGTVN